MNSFEKSFATRIQHIPGSFIREILKITAYPDTVSFAGGLPSASLFPAAHLRKATDEIFETDSENVLQYATSEGYLPLRAYIANWYKKQYNMNVDPDEILITHGSQQAMDLIAKLFLNPGEAVAMESPGYLGAIQLFSMYQAKLIPILLQKDGVSIQNLAYTLKKYNPKLLYMNPNYQNPTGITCSDSKRKLIADMINKNDTFLIEDDPYGALRYRGEALMPIKAYAPEKTILLGSFSKILAPSLRVGWLIAHKSLIAKLTVLKQASDLHTNFISQRIIYKYIENYSLEDHIEILKNEYAKKLQVMEDAIKAYFPSIVKTTKPEGGMFIWGTLPLDMDITPIHYEAMHRKIVFVPGEPFYIQGEKQRNTFRINFTNSSENEILTGIKIISDIMNTYLDR